MTPFEYAMLAVIAVFVALILLGVFRPPKVLREEAEDMLAYVRHALYDYELPEDRLVIARLTYGELEQRACRPQTHLR